MSEYLTGNQKHFICWQNYVHIWGFSRIWQNMFTFECLQESGKICSHLSVFQNLAKYVYIWVSSRSWQNVVTYPDYSLVLTESPEWRFGNTFLFSVFFAHVSCPQFQALSSGFLVMWSGLHMWSISPRSFV